jgi:predicted N-acetyltransferase YhbS
LKRYSIDTPYRQELGDGLVLKTASSEAEIERIAACHCQVFGEEKVGELCRRIFLFHPGTYLDDLIFVEDEKKTEVVSSICLIPWEWRYEDVILKAGEMGIVGTREKYRRRGLIRAQSDYLKKKLAERKFHLSHIQGIPYFYRQFGYEYTLPLEGGYRLELHQVPELKEGQKPVLKCRPEKSDDLPAVKKLYEKAIKELDIHALRNDGIWQYLSEHSQHTHTGYEPWVVEDTQGEITGYFRMQKCPFGPGITVYEASQMSYDTAIEILRCLKTLAIDRKKPYIRLILPKNFVLMETAKHHGACDTGTYAWQIYIPDMAYLIKSIGSVLEGRLAESPFANLTEDITLNLYEESITLSFKGGSLEQVQSKASAEGRIRIPPRAAVPLVLGYRSREELSDIWHDMGMPPKEEYLVDVLFPRMISHIFTIY